jgi:hypothetical protein
MTDQPESLAQTIRRRLDEGAAPDEVIDELVARGLSTPNAERFVERALDDMASAAVGAAQASRPRGSRGTQPSAIGRTGWMWIGIGLTALFLVSAGAGFAGYRTWQVAQAEEARKAAKARAELAAADQARAAEIRAESKARRGREMPQHAIAASRQIDRLLSELRADSPLRQCRAAMELKQFGERDHVKDLLSMYETARLHEVRGCALSAMVALGETTIPLQIYNQWRNDPNPEIRASATSGYAEIGPQAADLALPLLREQLASPHWDRRFVAVESLAKLGPSAKPLLEQAARDEEPQVRDRAAAVLKKMN